MEDIWSKLRGLQVVLNPEKSRLNSDKKYAAALMMHKAECNWRSFYVAVDALEKGCGYPPTDDLKLLCQAAASQDAKQLLNIIEQKRGMLDVVIFLRCTDKNVQLSWIQSHWVSDTLVLFELLRQILLSGTLSADEQAVIANGLCHLSVVNSDYFEYLLKHYLMYNTIHIPIVKNMLPSLDQKGWEAVSHCISFQEPGSNRMKFWDLCCKDLDWSVIHISAKPLVTAWRCHLESAISDSKFTNTLYHEMSNVLISILLYELDPIEKYNESLHQLITAGENAMYNWYPNKSHQVSALLAFLSAAEHLHYVWLNKKEAAPSILFRKDLRCKLLDFIAQWRFLWDKPIPPNIQQEITGLKIWLESVGEK